jgi:hypothetical protein
MYVDDDDEGYLVDAPVSQGDGFSFTGGKYSDEMGRADEWYARGKIVSDSPRLLLLLLSSLWMHYRIS